MSIPPGWKKRSDGPGAGRLLDGGGNVHLELWQIYELEEFGDGDAMKRMREEVFDKLPPKG